MCKGGLAPVAPKCRVVAADADEHERTRSLVTQPLPSKTPPAPSLKRWTGQVLRQAGVVTVLVDSRLEDGACLMVW